jgi:hypothetical protein
MVVWVSRPPLPVGRQGCATIDPGAFEAPIDKMFGAPNESRLYGSRQLVEGIRKELVHHPGGAGLPPQRKSIT